MEPTITSEIVVAYSQCPRKAYLLLFSPDKGEPHEYVQILEQQRCTNQEKYINRLQQTHADVQPYSVENLRKGSKVLTNAHLQVDGFAAECGILTRVEGTSTFGKYCYEPTIFVGTHSISKEQQLELSFVGYVLERLQHKLPATGRIIGMDGKSHTVKLDHHAKALRPLLEPLHEWITVDSPQPPPLVLNKHCSLCPFQRMCQTQAEQEDNLSLLNGMTARVMRQYERKGIFTVKQLSYLFKPRKRKIGRRKSSPATHKVELQALAIREHKIYLQELPDIPRHPIELFVDMEGVPDRERYYLIGVSVCQGDTTEHYAFWADTDHDEQPMWQQFVEKVAQYPDAPMYHYGSYELRAITTLAKRYQIDAQSVIKRLVNVNGYIYGKVYFPVRSNGLKDIGHCIGAQWTSPEASGLQSLVWRYHWEHTHDRQYREILVTYNREDCQALQVLKDELTKIRHAADTLSEVDFAQQPKRYATEVGKEVHRQLESILHFAHTNYDKRKISFRQGTVEAVRNDERKHRTHISYSKIHASKADRVIHVPPRTVCPRHATETLTPLAKTVERSIIDLEFTKRGVRKVILCYRGTKSRCRLCKHDYSPYGVEDRAFQLFGRRFQAWCIYKRLALHASYSMIAQEVQELFGEKVGDSSIPRFIKYFASYYAETEQAIVQRMLSSPHIHADETTISIKGTDYYVWVFTDGTHVVFKLTETREAKMVQDLLSSYSGILISDFFPGYDALQCQQQKCWVHLIRDLNEDLWKSPWDIEFENFIVEVRSLIVPIIATTDKYGLKRHHLQKFKRHVEAFYQQSITGKTYRSELVNTYQKRFIRYRESLFTFLEYDGVPWHNNKAENAIRHIARQRTISGSFFEASTHDYLRLLGMRQTCRFQGKPFLKFLLSEEKDIDTFKVPRRLKHTRESYSR
jgi:predicted RecB family nuclease